MVLLDILMGSLNVFGWGLKPLLEKQGIKHSSVFLFANTRYIFTAILCFIILLIYKGKNYYLHLNQKTVYYSILVSVVGLLSALSNYYLLSKYDANYVIGIVEPGVIVVTLILGYLFFNETLNLTRIIGIMVVCIGIYLIFISKTPSS